MPEEKKWHGETPKETRKRFESLDDDAVNVGKMDAGDRKRPAPPEGREWLAGAEPEAKSEKPRVRHDEE